MFLQAALTLDQAVHQAKAGQERKDDDLNAWAKVQADGQHQLYPQQGQQYPVLSSIIDPIRALT